MPTARESLLDAAHEAVSTRPWTGVRMVELAASAGVSRQTLYNEFGNKDGLGRALVHHRVEGFLRGAAAVAAQAVRGGADPPKGLAVAAGWMLRTIGGEPIVRCALTGCWTGRMPPAARGEPGTPQELADDLLRRLVAALAADAARAEPLHLACDAGLRLALSYVVVPVPGAEDEACTRIHDVTRALL
ncbi:TetR/AcrR family transcriptional regulator [Streptomyces sp. DSM 42041]|uniref:TetR/AcrR family transcriptional regulator n=1 Tax=Streptomyces hazeniae TaxID=3075538 RepID=A0ABU2NPC5_9ACTN|nr:TetR/AcrR family transcriptional regulator [Streptomyces sp. DSM 42041]MDT0378068.1 TetR/AcrR family transcriptional regulator [Streptomyces sp. DSM 42041]